MEFKLLNIVTIKRSKAPLDPNEKQNNSNLRETAIACHDGYGLSGLKLQLSWEFHIHSRLENNGVK